MMKFVKKPFFLVLATVTSLIVSLPVWSFSLKEPGVLSVCSYSEFKPVSYGDGKGYEADLLKAVAASWHVKIKFYPDSIYDGLWRMPSRNYAKCDVAIGGFTPTTNRKDENATFTMTTTRYDQSLLVRKEDYKSGKITSYDSFKNTKMKIGVVPGTTGEKYALIRAKKSGLPAEVFVQAKSEDELLPALLNKKIDALARGEIGNEYQESLNKNLITIAKENFDDGFAFAVDKSNPELIRSINSAIKKITRNGSITYKAWLKDSNVFSRQANR